MKIYVRHGNCFVGSEGLSKMARKLKRAAHIRGGGRNKLKISALGTCRLLLLSANSALRTVPLSRPYFPFQNKEETLRGDDRQRRKGGCWGEPFYYSYEINQKTYLTTDQSVQTLRQASGFTLIVNFIFMYFMIHTQNTTNAWLID